MEVPSLQELFERVSREPWTRLGASAEGRPICGRAFAGTTGAPPVLLFGAIHGNEPLGAYLLFWLAGVLDAAPPPPRSAWIVPIVNPDGFLSGAKNNGNGVDLNRNFPARNWTREHEPGYDPGLRGGSEPETRLLMDLIERSGATRLIALHSPFRTVNYDGSGKKLAERMAAQNGYAATADIGYPTPGSFGSLYGVDRNLEVITLEIPVLSPEKAWEENQAALEVTLDLPREALRRS